MKYKDLNDYELVELAHGSEEANEILFTKYKPLILSIAKKYYNPKLNVGYDYNDLVSEAMIAFASAINTFNPDKEAIFFTYARTCIERKMQTFIIMSQRLKQRTLNEAIPIDGKAGCSSLMQKIGDDSSNPETIVISHEFTTSLLKHLQSELSVKEAQVFELKKSGFNINEIAEILDIDYKQVDNTIQRIKNKAKQFINKSNGIK